MLLDPAHKIPGAFVGGCNLCNPVVKEGPFCRSCSRAEQTPILSGSCASISCKCTSALIVPPLLRLGGNSDIPSISLPCIGDYPRNCCRKQVQIVHRVQPGKVESTKPHSNRREKVVLLVTVAFEDLPAYDCDLWDDKHHVISLFGHFGYLENDAKVLASSVLRIARFIQKYPNRSCPIE